MAHDDKQSPGKEPNMRSSLVCIAVASSLLVVQSPATTPAQATTTGTVTVTGAMTLNGPLGDPCVPPTPGTPKCPPGTPTVKTFHLPGSLTPAPNSQVNPGGGNSRTYSFGATTCTALLAHANKLQKPPADVPPTQACTFFSVGSLRGFCGMLLGAGAAMLTAAGQNYTVSLQFADAVKVLVVSGHITKTSTGRRGLFSAQGTMSAVPTPETTPPGLRNKCIDKTATQFTVTFTGEVKITN